MLNKHWSSFVEEGIESARFIIFAGLNRSQHHNPQPAKQIQFVLQKF
jgi:hypothetical protein